MYLKICPSKDPHPENEKLMPALAKVDSLYTDKGSPEPTLPDLCLLAQ